MNKPEVMAFLEDFKEKVEEAVGLLPDMSTEAKVKAVQYWNLVSERLQGVASNSASDVPVRMEEDGTNSQEKRIDTQSVSSVSVRKRSTDALVNESEVACEGNSFVEEKKLKKESEEKLKQQQLEATRRENILVMRLTTKEQEMQDFVNQIQELKQSQIPGNNQLEATLVDPAVYFMFEKMKKAVDTARTKVDEMQSELSAWKFTPDSNTGKRLMAKCRLLYQENEELGKIVSSGRVAKLEGDLALQKTFSDEMKKSQSELDDFLLELDEDVEGMQNTIVYLQLQLKEAKEAIERLEKELNSRQNNCKTDNVVKDGETSNLHTQSEHCANDNDNITCTVNNNERTTDCKSHVPGQNSFKNMFQQVSGVLRTASMTTNGPHNASSTESNDTCVEDKELRTRHSKSCDIKQSEAESMPPVSQKCFSPSFFT